MTVKNSVLIEATPSAVWDALTNPVQTKKYMFGCEALSGWKKNDPLIWKGIFNGKELVAVKGHIVDIQKYRFLAYTVFDPNSTIEDKPENYTTVTYSLTASGGFTVLEVTQGDFSKVAEGERRFREVAEAGGWEPILKEIKKLVENG
ncbi:MAG TPA: SRPBCC domain-containing protein [Chryseosolibacter sp.]|nr:SRPBCC domain-containing protein [Chryseosolibacter sp.]